MGNEVRDGRQPGRMPLLVKTLNVFILIAVFKRTQSNVKVKPSELTGCSTVKGISKTEVMQWCSLATAFMLRPLHPVTAFYVSN